MKKQRHKYGLSERKIKTYTDLRISLENRYKNIRGQLTERRIHDLLESLKRGGIIDDYIHYTNGSQEDSNGRDFLIRFGGERRLAVYLQVKSSKSGIKKAIRSGKLVNTWLVHGRLEFKQMLASVRNRISKAILDFDKNIEDDFVFQESEFI